jgi:enoyl-CoA hydratase/carnithine racemase
VIREEDDPVEPTLRWVILDRVDKANALDDAMVDGLQGALARARADGMRTVALRSTGRTFCAGLDLSTPQDDRSVLDALLLRRLTRIAAVLEEWRASRMATAVVVGGGAHGAGADLSLACQFRVAVEGAQWAFPGPRFGIALGTDRLAQIVGADRARLLLLRQDRIDHRRALDLGLVHVASPDVEAAVAEVRDHAGRVARLAPQAVEAVLAATDHTPGYTAVGALAESAAAGSISDRLAAYREAIGRPSPAPVAAGER